MECIAKNVKKYDPELLDSIEANYSINIREDIKLFIKNNSGGYPIKNIILSEGEEYEVRVFLSSNYDDKNYSIEKPLNYFLQNTKGRIIPIGIDSGDNYYCVNNESGKVYFWKASDEIYYCISNNLEEFTMLFK